MFKKRLIHNTEKNKEDIKDFLNILIDGSMVKKFSEDTDY